MNRLLFDLADALSDKKEQTIPVEISEVTAGQIIHNRIVGIAYDKLDLSKPKDKDIEKGLSAIYQDKIMSTRKYKENLNYVASILENVKFKYALLKGAYLTSQLYKEGHRTSNDIDILISADDISSLQDVLLKNGFVQGQYKKGKGIIESSRMEVIQARMNFGETIPFLKMIGDNPLEIDINFSVDFKPEGNKGIVKDLLDSTMGFKAGEYEPKTLNAADFLIHLCCHLYKEATTYHWVEDHRDLQLYKFSDINLYLHKFGNDNYFNKLLQRVKVFNVEKECYLTFFNSQIIFPKLKQIPGFEKFINDVKPDNTDFMQQVFSPLQKKLFKHDMDFTSWFFSSRRITHLKEIPYVDGEV